MPDQPSNAPADLKDQATTDARDDAEAAAVLSDARMEDEPGGGGLGGDDAGRGAAGEVGGASPSTPSDVQASAGDAAAPREARIRTTDETTR